MLKEFKVDTENILEVGTKTKCRLFKSRSIY